VEGLIPPCRVFLSLMLWAPRHDTGSNPPTLHHPKSVLTATPCLSAASSGAVRPLASTEGIAACLSVYNNHTTVEERTLIEALNALPVPRNFADAEVGALDVDH
jgi:hypothetical protein